MMPKIQQIETFDKFLQSSKKRVNVVYGGAGSGKSISVAQHLLGKFLREDDKRILITRKTLPSLRITAWYEIVRMLTAWGIPVDINKSEFTIRFGNNEILAKSMDEPEKIKSAEFNYIWIEEATEINKEDFKQLDLRLRKESKDGKPNQIYLTFNPIDQFHWVIEDLVYGTSKDAYKREDIAIHHSTYKDNPFLPPEYCKRLEDFINQDENFYRIYTLGEPGVLENIIYKNYKIDPYDQKAWDEIFYGLDFGYNNPSALIAIRVRDQTLYLKELLYESNLTNSDLIQRLKPLKIDKSAIYADAAEPQRIQEFHQAGFTIYPADKSIKDGIDTVKRYQLHIHPDSPNLIAEIRGYSYRKDKDGRVLEEPVKFKDHCMDAMRYAIHSWQKRQGIKTTVIGVTRKW
jgi:phage terminase large subunit